MKKTNQDSKKANGNSGDKENFDKASPLEQFFTAQLKDMYYAERRIGEMLDEMISACYSEELEDSVMRHRNQTERHKKRLQKIFSMIGVEAEENKCEAVEGLIKEAKEIRDMTRPETATRDAAMIIALQKIEHYEIATYGGLLELAITMDLHQAARLLDKTLVEEEECDGELTDIAESFINVKAEQEGPYSWQRQEEAAIKEE